MPAATQNITIEKGATFVLALTFQQPAGVAMNLAGYSAKAQLRRRAAGELVQALTCTVTAPASGTVQVALTATQTLALTEGTYVWDLIIVSGATVTRVLEGTAVVVPQVTVNE